MKRLLPGLLLAGAFFLFQGPEIFGQASQGDFSRPLRNLPVIRSDHPARRELLPPFYTEGGGAANPHSFLNPRDLDRELTQHYINQYSSSGGLEWLKGVMERGAPYLGFIRREIAERRLPPEFIYLPVIESGYLSTALSRSGALGLWQFMKNSIAPFDMKVNDWMDERRDFWKSTQGALGKLEDNYRHFKDWPLALAAYNAGLGAVSGIVKRSGIEDYWLLSEQKLLKTETLHYVPKLLAVSYILSNPRRFGLVLWPEDPNWTRVEVNASVDLAILAREAGIDPAELKKANPELSYGITPPEKGYFLKIKGLEAEKVAEVLERGMPLINYHIHTIRSGDTLSALAVQYGVPLDQITALNPGIRARYLRLGATLMIPALRGIVERPALRPSSPEGLEFSGTHLVKPGESLWSIALAWGVSPEILAEANNMGLNDILREGRVLKTPIKE